MYWETKKLVFLKNSTYDFKQEIKKFNPPKEKIKTMIIFSEIKHQLDKHQGHKRFETKLSKPRETSTLNE